MADYGTLGDTSSPQYRLKLLLLLLLLKFYLESQTKRAGLPNIMMAIL